MIDEWRRLYQPMLFTQGLLGICSKLGALDFPDLF